MPVILGVSLDEGWYYASTARPEKAMEIAVSILKEDPEDLGGHLLYSWVLDQALRDGPMVKRLYSGLDQDPGRFVSAFLKIEDKAGSWCEEVEKLLFPLPEDPTDKYYFLWVRSQSRFICGGDYIKDQDSIIALDVGVAKAHALKIRVDRGVTPDLVNELVEFWRTSPQHFASTGDLWKAKGAAVEDAQMALLELANDSLTSTDPLVIDGIVKVARQSGDFLMMDAAQDQLFKLDPGWATNVTSSEGDSNWVIWPQKQKDPLILKIRTAARSRDQEAIKKLKALNLEIPVSGVVRMTYEELSAQVYLELKQPEMQIEALEKAWRAMPNDPRIANNFAYVATKHNLKLETALEAAKSSVDNTFPFPYDPRSQMAFEGLEGWHKLYLTRLSARYDTLAWVYYKLGQLDQAEINAQLAVNLAPEPSGEAYAHLGQIYYAREKRDLALRYLSFALGTGVETGLSQEISPICWQLVQELRWAPDLDSWIKSQADSVLSTEVLPDFSFTVDNVTQNLSNFKGLRVVDLWATWCVPCKRSLNHLSELSKHYTNVTYIAVSIDDEPPDHKPIEGLIMGWGGPVVGDLLEIESVPKIWIINEKGEILVEIGGYGTGDLRLDLALDRLTRN